MLLFFYVPLKNYIFLPCYKYANNEDCCIYVHVVVACSINKLRCRSRIVPKYCDIDASVQNQKHPFRPSDHQERRLLSTKFELVSTRTHTKLQREWIRCLCFLITGSMSPLEPVQMPTTSGKHRNHSSVILISFQDCHFAFWRSN